VPALPARPRVTLLARRDWHVAAGAPCGLITIGTLASHLNVTLTPEVDMSVVRAQRELLSERES
jgi:hypothetical protein